MAKLIKLTKPRAKYTITFKPDKDDDHFVYIIFTDKNGKEVKKPTMIIKKDVDTWIKDYVSNGWIKE